MMNKDIIFVLLIFLEFSAAQICSLVNSRGSGKQNCECFVTDYKVKHNQENFSCLNNACDKEANNITTIKFHSSDNTIKYLPKNIDKKFPNIQSIIVISAYLKEISSDDLQPFKNLTFLSLESNVIKKLPENLFQHNKKLEIINLGSNKIYFIHPTAFDGLNALKVLNLTGNICKFETAKDPEETLKLIENIKNSECAKPTIEKLNNTSDASTETCQENDNFVLIILNIFQFIIIIFGIFIFLFIKLNTSKKKECVKNTIVDMQYNEPVDVEPIYEDVEYIQPVKE